MGQQTYAELLRHPEWQKKRLKIMERDRFKCRDCHDKDTTLNVHHSHYRKGAKPWEYPDDSLLCLCETCHMKRHATTDEIKAMVGVLDKWFLEYLRGFLYAHALECAYGPENVNPSLKITTNRDVAQMQLMGVCGYNSGHDTEAFEEALVAAIDSTGRLFLNDISASRDRFFANIAKHKTEPPAVTTSALESGRSLTGDCRA